MAEADEASTNSVLQMNPRSALVLAKFSALLIKPLCLLFSLSIGLLSWMHTKFSKQKRGSLIPFPLKR